MATVIPTDGRYDSRSVMLQKINNNLVSLFSLMSSGTFVGQLVPVAPSYPFSDSQVLQAICNNIANYFNAGGGGGGGGPFTGGQIGALAISNGVNFVDVTFPTPFAAAPKVLPGTTSANSGDDNIYAEAVAITKTGFRAQLSGTTADANHTLTWIAWP